MNNGSGWFGALAVMTILGTTPPTAAAQTPAFGYSFGSLGFTAPAASGLLHGGGGGEFPVDPRITIGAELGYMGALQEPTAGFGLLSINGTHHPKGMSTVTKRPQPFVTAGYTVAFSTSGFGGNHWNIGAGAHWWHSPHVGLRFELRDQIFDPRFHVIGARLGVVFR